MASSKVKYCRPPEPFSKCSLIVFDGFSLLLLSFNTPLTLTVEESHTLNGGNKQRSLKGGVGHVVLCKAKLISAKFEIRILGIRKRHKLKQPYNILPIHYCQNACILSLSTKF